MIKNALLALASAALLTSCAGVHVTHTEVATGATRPSAIYVRPFQLAESQFTGHRYHSGEGEILRSLAPAELAEDLKEELSKIAPALVIKDDETAATGWLVEGEFVRVDAGSPLGRFLLPGTYAGHSKIKLHVRVLDATKTAKHDGKGGSENVLYEFDVAGGSGLTGRLGGANAGGAGFASEFDYRNAAERIAFTLTPDPNRYGVRSSSGLR